MTLEMIILPVVLAIAIYALRSYWRGRDKLDLFYAVAMFPWAALIALSLLGDQAWLSRDGQNLTLLIRQFTIVGLSAFLLQSIDDLKLLQVMALIAQTVLGVALAAIPLMGLGAELRFTLPDVLAHGWTEVNSLFATLLLIRLTQRVWHGSTPEGWMVLLVTIVGLGFIIGDVRSASLGMAEPSVSDYFFAVALSVLWLVLTRRIGAPMPKSSPHSEEKEPKQLAQDLHDGVGSHLASIIAGLEIGTAQQRATAMALQHCLLELKMLVDGEGQDRSVIEHLACLRYRLQPMLQSAGIQMNWKMSDDEELEQLRGDAARQVLRVAQEALANVVRHSGAYEVAVTCGYAKPQHVLILEISDNGIGLPQNLQMAGVGPPSSDERSSGKGLSGMAWRARKLGAELMIDAVNGEGTRVRLLLPIGVLTEVER